MKDSPFKRRSIFVFAEKLHVDLFLFVLYTQSHIQTLVEIHLDQVPCLRAPASDTYRVQYASK